MGKPLFLVFSFCLFIFSGLMASTFGSGTDLALDHVEAGFFFESVDRSPVHVGERRTLEYGRGFVVEVRDLPKGGDSDFYKVIYFITNRHVTTANGNLNQLKRVVDNNNFLDAHRLRYEDDPRRFYRSILSWRVRFINGGQEIVDERRSGDAFFRPQYGKSDSVRLAHGINSYFLSGQSASGESLGLKTLATCWEFDESVMVDKRRRAKIGCDFEIGRMIVWNYQPVTKFIRPYKLGFGLKPSNVLVNNLSHKIPLRFIAKSLERDFLNTGSMQKAFLIQPEDRGVTSGWSGSAVIEEESKTAVGLLYGSWPGISSEGLVEHIDHIETQVKIMEPGGIQALIQKDYESLLESEFQPKTSAFDLFKISN